MPLPPKSSSKPNPSIIMIVRSMRSKWEKSQSCRMRVRPTRQSGRSPGAATATSRVVQR